MISVWTGIRKGEEETEREKVGRWDDCRKEKRERQEVDQMCVRGNNCMG